MKKILALCAFTLVAAAALVWHATARPRSFGAFAGAPTVEVSAVIAQPEQFRGKTVRIKGEISEQCKTMGCYFFFRSGKDELRVDLQEVAMHAPMHEGGVALVEGQIVPYNGGYQFYASAVEFE